jgi:excisionase family DNA binding protein
MTETRWVSRKEAAHLMGVTERTIHRWMAARKLKFRRDKATGRVLVEIVTVKS